MAVIIVPGVSGVPVTGVNELVERCEHLQRP